MRGVSALPLAVAVILPAYAEPTPDDVSRAVAAFDEVVVVATKRETNIRDVAADVTVLDAADLQATMSTSLADIFRFVPGVTHEASGSRFGAEGVTIRGIGGNRIAMELDGVPLSDQFDVGNFSNATRDFADTGILGQIEVLRGPASAMYGSSALGGVVAMRTLDPRAYVSEKPVFGRAAFLYRGVDDSRNTQASLGMKGARVSVLVAGSYRDGTERQSAALDEAKDTQSYLRDSALVKVVGENRLGHGWQLSVVRQSQETQTWLTTMLGSGRFASTTRLEGDDTSEILSVSAEYRFAAGWIDAGLVRVFHAEADISQRTLDERALARSPVSIERGFFFDQQLRGVEINLSHDTEKVTWSHRFGLGFEYTESDTEELRDGLSTSLLDGSQTADILGERFPLRDFPITEKREIGAYLSSELTRGPMSLITALRFDENRLTPTSDAIFAADNPSTAVVALQDSDVSPKLGAIYRLGEDVDVYVQYTHGFRAPPFEDANIGLDIPLFNIRAIPNPDLKSETSKGWELGMRWQGRRSRVQLGAFQTDYSDFIATKVRIGVDPLSGRLLFQSINIGNAYIRGMEASWAQDLSALVQGMTLKASASWAEGKNRDNGQPLNSVGPAEAVLGAYWQSGDEKTEICALLAASARWSRRDETSGELFEPAGHAVLDVFLARTISENLTVRANIGNVTDRVYWRWSEVSGLAPDDVLLPTLAAAGRNFSIGLQWNW